MSPILEKRNIVLEKLTEADKQRNTMLALAEKYARKSQANAVFNTAELRKGVSDSMILSNKNVAM